ncbi:unnamed protein product [Allacma fusca]|uniref:Uncharacterized protein n=1 Tax=Allacma fusca TaxID=39272 RepID=A0A8J2PJU4_9HEXA|nr:unnamed protein product [Allacma fusca]
MLLSKPVKTFMAEGLEMEPRSDITELAQKIEAAFISQVREEELRAKRTLRVLQHQQEQIRRLQRLQQVQQLDFQDISSGLSKASQDATANERKDDLMEQIRLDELRRRKSPTQDGNRACNKKTSTEEILEDNSTHKGLPKTSEPQNVQKEIQYTKDVLLRSKGKIETLEKAAWGLEGSGSEVNLLAEEMSGWRSTIDNALLTIETTAMVEERIWKTALEFFTPQEALHFLTAEKIEERGRCQQIPTKD